MSCLFCKADIQSKGRLDNKINDKRAQILALVFTKLCNLLNLYPNSKYTNWNFKEHSFPFCQRCRIQISKLCRLQDQIKLMEQRILRIITKLYVLTIESDFSNPTNNVSQKAVDADYFRRAILSQFQANVILRDCRSEFPEHCHTFTKFEKSVETLEDSHIDKINPSSTVHHGDDIKFDSNEENNEIPLDVDQGNDILWNECDITVLEAIKAMDFEEEKYESEQNYEEGRIIGEENNDNVIDKYPANEIQDSGNNSNRDSSVAESENLADVRETSVINNNESEDNIQGIKIEAPLKLTDGDNAKNRGKSSKHKSSEVNNSNLVKHSHRRTNPKLTSEQRNPSKNTQSSHAQVAAPTNSKNQPPYDKLMLIGKNLYQYKSYKLEIQKENAICLTCGRKFKLSQGPCVYRKNFKKHINTVHLVKVQSPAGKVFLLDASSKRYTMDGFEFTSTSDGQNYLCLTCNKVTKPNNGIKNGKFMNIRMHIRKHHLLSFQGVCPICGEMQTDLPCHKVSAHSQKICEKCGKVCTGPAQLIQHLKTHQDPSEYEHKCEKCGKAFKLKSILQNHLQIHSAKQFICDVCGKGFNFEQVLKTHIASKHAKTRPFACNQCDWTFGVKFLLNRHIRQVHEGKKPPPPKKRKKVVAESTEESSTSSSEEV